jgi:hypothetical protein
MRIAIIGGTGTLGRQVAAQLRDRGHEVRVLSRSAPEHRVDLRTGAGLEEGLRGCQAVVDASNDSSRDAARLLVDGTRRLLAAEQAAGVTHHVGVSIVGCELVPLGYFRAKAAQEQVLEHGPLPWTIVRATQFHELAAATLASAGRWRLVPVPPVVLQTVAAAVVGLAARDRVPVPVAGDGHRVDRVDRAAGGAQAGGQQPAWCLDRHRHGVLARVAVPGEQVQQLREPGRVVADAAAGQQLPVPVHHGDVVVVFGPVDAAEHVHDLLFPPFSCCCRRSAAQGTHAP